MSRSQRRRNTKSLRRIKIRKGESRHHLTPKSLGGTNHESNISIVLKSHHEAWHTLFSNLSPETIADIINQKWISKQYKFICIKRKDTDVPNEMQMRSCVLPHTSNLQRQ